MFGDKERPLWDKSASIEWMCKQMWAKVEWKKKKISTDPNFLQSVLFCLAENVMLWLLSLNKETIPCWSVFPRYVFRILECTGFHAQAHCLRLPQHHRPGLVCSAEPWTGKGWALPGNLVFCKHWGLLLCNLLNGQHSFERQMEAVPWKQSRGNKKQ